MSASAVLRRRLSEKLYTLREQRGLTQQQVADALNVTVRTITRAETAVSTPGARDLAKFLDYYGVHLEEREELLDLGTQARKRGGWWSAYKDLLPGPYVQLEDEAREVRSYQSLLVPGLLQTEDYVRAAFAVFGTTDIERHIEARMRRQKRITNGDLSIRAVIDEAVLSRMPDATTATGQLQRLRELMKLPNVDLRILPRSAGLYPAMGHSFTVLSFRAAADPDVAMAETWGGEKYFDDAEEVMRINATFDEIGGIALGGDQSEIRINEELEILIP